MFRSLQLETRLGRFLGEQEKPLNEECVKKSLQGNSTTLLCLVVEHGFFVEMHMLFEGVDIRGSLSLGLPSVICEQITGITHLCHLLEIAIGEI